MKIKSSLEKFNYSKYELTSNWDADILKEQEYWGIHKTDNGKIVIDTERYIKACEKIGINDFVPNAFKTNTIEKHFYPSKREKYDYIFNIFNDKLNEFKNDWEYEFKPIFKKILTPSEVYENTRLNSIMYTSCSDDYDEIELDSMMSSLRRYPKYEKVIQSLYCQFINKLATETDRITLIAICRLGYKGKDYSFTSFAKFSDGLAGNKSNKKIKDLDKYNAYNLLHKINNFLKHNTISSYDDLKKHYPDNVASLENGKSTIRYENGMFAGDWIIVKKDYIDNLIEKLRKFFKDYCKQFVKENVEESCWNYDKYFVDAFYNLSNPHEYFGV